jgi:hypothetical protein
VCGAQNDDLTVVCSSCKSYLQTKVDNLNLFETLWGLMESPRATFKRIALARHKNYVLLLSCLLGAALVYGIFWFMTMGPKFSNVATLIVTGVVIGPPAGVLFVVVFSAGLRVIGRMLGGRGSFRNVMGTVAYASAPIVYSLVFVFPIEIAIFGIYFFSDNPPPLAINPFLYLALLSLDVVAFVWSGVLLIVGSGVAMALPRVKAVALSVIGMGALGAGAFALRMM